MKMPNRYKDTLLHLQQEGNFRVLPQLDANLLDLSSNDYLSINADKDLYVHFTKNLSEKHVAFSAASSRLLSGNNTAYYSLEERMTNAFNAEACLIYNSGYHANIGILPALACKKDLILADKLVHASIIDGMRLSEATSMRYKHLDLKHLEALLIKYRDDYEQVFIVTESIFSMDGDIPDLKKLVALKKKFNCYLYVDEAHAFGVRGTNGLGCLEEAELIQDCDFIVGTFGKAIASVGAYVICSDEFKQYLVNFSRTLIFTTGLPPVNLAWTEYIVNLLPSFNEKRIHLTTLSQAFAQLLKIQTDSHIVPYIIGSNQEAIAQSNKLAEAGFNVKPIRFPTVPKGTARLRFSLNAGMNMNDLSQIGKILFIR